MAYVITRLCQNCVHGACVDACPVDCIVAHRPEGEASDLPNQLFIDPNECIDCNHCVAQCPWEAIYAQRDVPDVFRDDIALNAEAARRNGLVRLRSSASDAPSAEQITQNKRRWGLPPTS